MGTRSFQKGDGWKAPGVTAAESASSWAVGLRGVLSSLVQSLLRAGALAEVVSSTHPQPLRGAGLFYFESGETVAGGAGVSPEAVGRTGQSRGVNKCGFFGRSKDRAFTSSAFGVAGAELSSRSLP